MRERNKIAIYKESLPRPLKSHNPIEENRDTTIHMCTWPGSIQNLVLVSHHQEGTLVYRTLVNHLTWMTQGLT